MNYKELHPDLADYDINAADSDTLCRPFAGDIPIQSFDVWIASRDRNFAKTKVFSLNDRKTSFPKPFVHLDLLIFVGPGGEERVAAGRMKVIQSGWSRCEIVTGEKFPTPV